MTAGRSDASVTVAAPASKPVTGEAALVGALKAAPACLGQAQLDPNRVRLAYEQLKATEALAEASDLTRASAVFLDALHAVVTGDATDGPAIDGALTGAASRHGVFVDDAVRSQLLHLLDELRGIDFGLYARGYRIEELGPDEVRVVPSRTD
jgi:uncharacterized protein YpuA (DUF1002 family)